MKVFWNLVISLGFYFTLLGQVGPDQNLALQYYRNEEYDKAAELFEKLYKENSETDYYYRYYYNCLLKLEDYKRAEKLIKKRIKDYPGNQMYVIDLGYAYSQQGDVEGAYNQYEAAINNMPANKNDVIRVASTLSNIREYDYAVKAYERGRKIVQSYPFYNELANLYRAIGNRTKMIENYLDYIQYSPQQMSNVQNILQDYVDDDDTYREMQRLLYQRIQSNPDLVFYNEMLIWLFIQKKDFESAFIQAKALDKRNQEDGKRIFDLGLAARNEKQYDAAIEALTYLINKGQTNNNKYYFYARESILDVKKEKITNSYGYTQEELLNLKKGYTDFLSEFEFNRLKTANTIRNLAQLEAFYLHDLDTAITLLEDLISTPGINDNFISEAKLDLGDFYLLQGEVWEATLLYSQVDKKMKDEPLGEMARFKNAKLYYYLGDFTWSQSQLDVLKGSTSELIANDALELSVFITSNLGLDTTSLPMRMFARADLAMYQNRVDLAMETLDTILTQFKTNQLVDDIYFLKAKVMLKEQKYDEAINFLQMVEEQSSDRLLKDDAIFMLGKLYEEVWNDPEKAMAEYEKLLMDYKDSIFVVEARQRFRRLRGDKLN